MITYHKGNVLGAQVQALVNTVNTVGVMGKGIALQFKEVFPDNFKLYKQAFQKGELRIGKMFVFVTHRLDGVQYIINFPTKNEWFRPSSYKYIEDGLQDLANVISTLKIKSIAIPPLGCGNGGLSWDKVKPLIIQHLGQIESVDIKIFEPDEKVKDILIANEKVKEVKLTAARAMLLYALFHYEALGEEASLFAANKLSYFLQSLGEKQLKLQFVRHHYGPYSNQVDHLMLVLNGKYIKGLEQMQVKPFESLQLNYDTYSEVTNYYKNQLTNNQRENLTKLIEFVKGYESPLALEALASVHSLLKDYPDYSDDKIFDQIQNWSDRKRMIFNRQQIQAAFNRVKEYQKELLPH